MALSLLILDIARNKYWGEGGWISGVSNAFDDKNTV